LIYFDQQLQPTHARPKHALHASMKVSFSQNHAEPFWNGTGRTRYDRYFAIFEFGRGFYGNTYTSVSSGLI